MGNYAVKETDSSTSYEVLDPLLEQHIKELNDKIKLRESSLASFCKTTADPKDQPSPASIVTAINNRCETDKVEFNTLRSELLTRELQERYVLERFLGLMDLYIQRSRLLTRLVEKTEQGRAEREGMNVSFLPRMKPFGDHRMFVRMKLDGKNTLAKLPPRRGRDEHLVEHNKETPEEANVEPEEASVEPEAKKGQDEKGDEEALHK